MELSKIFKPRKCTSILEGAYLKGARMRNCIEKDVVITVDKCRKERRKRNSRRLMTPSISFYTSCDVTKHQPSFPFGTLDAYSRVKSVHLERHPFSLPSPSSPSTIFAFRPRPLCVTVLRACLRTHAGRQPISNERIGHGIQEGFQRDEKLMVRQVPERYYYFG